MKEKEEAIKRLERTTWQEGVKVKMEMDDMRARWEAKEQEYGRMLAEEQ